MRRITAHIEKIRILKFQRLCMYTCVLYYAEKILLLIKREICREYDSKICVKTNFIMVEKYFRIRYIIFLQRGNIYLHAFEIKSREFNSNVLRYAIVKFQINFESFHLYIKLTGNCNPGGTF